MSRFLLPVLVVAAACDDDMNGFGRDDDELVDLGWVTGQWELRLTCAEGSDVTAFPSCVTPESAIVELVSDAPPRGDHLTLFPGLMDGDGYVGMRGPVGGSFEDGWLRLALAPDDDFVLASAADREVWRGRVLTVVGQPSSACWTASWTFGDEAGTLVEGTATVRRPDDGPTTPCR